MAEAQQVAMIPVPDDWTPLERVEFAREVVDFIQARTDSGRDVNGTPFARYSDTYAESLDFRLAGKSKNNVNLKLTGEMMNTLDVVSHSTGVVYLGYRGGTAENDKAAWAAASDNGPSRKFLGLGDSDRQRLVRSFEERAGITARRQGEETDDFERSVRRTSRILGAALRAIAVRRP